MPRSVETNITSIANLSDETTTERSQPSPPSPLLTLPSRRVSITVPRDRSLRFPRPEEAVIYPALALVNEKGHAETAYRVYEEEGNWFLDLVAKASTADHATRHMRMAAAG